MTSRKRLAAAIGELLNRFSHIWVAEAFLAEYRKSRWADWSDERSIAEMETLVVTWLRRERAENNKWLRDMGAPPLPKRPPWTGKRTRKKKPRKVAPRKEGA